MSLNFSRSLCTSFTMIVISCIAGTVSSFTLIGCLFHFLRWKLSRIDHLGWWPFFSSYPCGLLFCERDETCFVTFLLLKKFPGSFVESSVIISLTLFWYYAFLLYLLICLWSILYFFQFSGKLEFSDCDQALFFFLDSIFFRLALIHDSWYFVEQVSIGTCCYHSNKVINDGSLCFFCTLIVIRHYEMCAEIFCFTLRFVNVCFFQ